MIWGTTPSRWIWQSGLSSTGRNSKRIPWACSCGDPWEPAKALSPDASPTPCWIGVDRMLKTGQLPAAKLGGQYRVRTDDFLKWWDNQVKQEQKNILKNLVS